MNRTGNRKGVKLSEEAKSQISATCKKVGVGKWMVGKKQTAEQRKKRSDAMRGEKHPNWQGGLRTNKKHLRELRMAWIAKNPYAIMDARMRSKEWKRKNPEKLKTQLHKRRALKMGADGVHSTEEWENLKILFKNRCARCKLKTKLTRDHIVPLCLGGSNSIENIQPLCLPCNLSKHTSIIKYEPTK